MVFQQLAIAPLEEHGGCSAAGGQQQAVPAELIHGPGKRRQQRQNDPAHDPSGILIGPNLGLIGNIKNDSLFLFRLFLLGCGRRSCGHSLFFGILTHCLASFAAAASAFAFSAAALAWNISFAVLNAWVSGILAGQL